MQIRIFVRWTWENADGSLSIPVRTELAASVKGMDMRFFWMICLIGILAGSSGCMTRNWNSPDSLTNDQQKKEPKKEFSVFSNGTMEKELFGTGVEPKAREIEKRLGFKQR